jgi:hypothetical protein
MASHMPLLVPWVESRSGSSMCCAVMWNPSGIMSVEQAMRLNVWNGITTGLAATQNQTSDTSFAKRHFADIKELDRVE